MNAATERANRHLLARLMVVAVVMFGFAWALIPFYREICAALGLNQLEKPAAAPVNTQVDWSRTVGVSLDANPQPGSPLLLVPMTRAVTLHPGELGRVDYLIVNQSAHPVWAQAIPAYVPTHAAQWFHKLECFCFRELLLAPGEQRKLPVVFVVDRALPASVGQVTLSYRVIEVAGRQAT